MKKWFLIFLSSALIYNSHGEAAAPEHRLQLAVNRCGGNFIQWKESVVSDAVALGISQRTITQFKEARLDPRVIQHDRSQQIFTLNFIDFSTKILSVNRLEKAQTNLTKYQQIFSKAEQRFGVPAAVLVALWGLESGFGSIQGDFNTLNALTTLAYDCRRPELFRPQLLALLQLFDQGVIDATTTGAWAGEIGQMQLLPKDYLELGEDGNHDGRVDLKNSVADAMVTAARMLSRLGWRTNEPWLIPVRIIDNGFAWQDADSAVILPADQWIARGVRPLKLDHHYDKLQASLVLPSGRYGPAFLAFANYDIFLKWNKSNVYATTAAYFAARLAGQPPYITGQIEQGLTKAEMKILQEKLQKRGYDIGKIDGVLGAATRNAVRREQLRLHLPADAWPTMKLLNKL